MKRSEIILKHIIKFKRLEQLRYLNLKFLLDNFVPIIIFYLLSELKDASKAETCSFGCFPFAMVNRFCRFHLASDWSRSVVKCTVWLFFSQILIRHDKVKIGSKPNSRR